MPKNMKYDAVSSKAGVKKTNQDGGGDSSSAAAKQLKELGANKKYKGGPKYMDEGAEKKYKGGAKLSPKQEKMDKNKNGKIDGQDFKLMGANRMGYTQTPGAARKKMGDVVQGIMRNGPADMTGKPHKHGQRDLDANRKEVLNSTQPPIAGRDKLLEKYRINAPKFGNKTASEHLSRDLKQLTSSQRRKDSITMTENSTAMFQRVGGKLITQKNGSPKTDPKAEALKAAQNFADSNKIAKTDKIKASQLYGNMSRAKHAGMKAHATTGNLTQILGKGLPKGENPKTTEFFVDDSRGMKPKTF